ncbi:MAG: beta-N-acetylhexosaminidase [Hyphomicrobiales bacterium]|nr:beta-N-acetylhexosaminidase [Hyphomicrobiales bacterium]MCP5002126.1 beta-N-acetylhexosaminidase [Hyphomicrobiales bacterium]
MTESKAMILGCGGLELTDEERAFYAVERPWGFILFARNISERNQISDLVADLRNCVNRPDAPVLIDQEGGRVQRIRPPITPSYPSASVIGEVYRKDPRDGLRAAWLMGRLHAFDLSAFGINVDCLPVLDVPVEGGHDVIGNRAFSNDPQAVVRLGRAAMDGLIAGGVQPVIKHLPGHGRAMVDSHLSLPVVDATLDQLAACDFVPFAALADAPMAMTAHIVFTAIDPDHPATSSSKIIAEIIRKKIGFNGLLMSDDVSMKALSGDFASKADAIFRAGCDVILHCNGVLGEMTEISAHTPVLRGAALQRAEQVMSLFDGADGENENTLRAEFDGLVAGNMSLV